MFIQLTDAGVAMLTTTGQPFIVTEYRLGSAFNYTPQTNQTALQGTEVWSGVPSDPVEVSANLVRYSALLGMSVGDFQFGEFALYVGATMVAIGVSSTLIAKTKTTTGLDGNFLRLDAYLNMTGTNYAMWLNFGDSANPFAMPSVQNVDQLPPSHQSVPNAYIVNSVSSNQEAFFAYSDRTGLWVFDAYKYSSTIGNRYTIVSASSLSVTIADASLAPDLTPGVYGDRIVQFASGQVYSICRNVQTVTPDLANNQVTLGFQTPLAIVPLPGDEFLVYNRDPLSTDTVMVPVATTTSLGIIQVGAGLAITPAGILSVDRTTVPDGLVYSIAGIEPDGTPVQRQGDVTLTWRDVGAIRSVNSQLPDANGNVVINVSYTLPVASSTVLGGVRIQAGSGLQINPVNGDLSLVGAGTAVESVNSRPGPAVIVAGLVDPSPLANATDLNTVIVGKIYYAATDAVALSLLNAPTIPAGRKSATIEVVALYELAGTGDVMQRWTQEDAMVYRRLTGNSWGPWVNPSTAGLPIATTSTVGVVSISDGLNVSPVGVLKTNIVSVNGHNGITDPQGNPETPFIVLSAADVQAVPIASVGAQGGVAGPLTDDPVDPPPDQNVSNYTYGRIPEGQLPLGGLYYLTTWNASTNVATYTDPDTTFVHTLTFLAGGLMQDDWNDGAAQTMTVPANGKVFKVTTAGTTSLDGVTSWAVNDWAVALGDTWVKVTGGGSSGVASLNALVGALTLSNGTGITLAINSGTGTITINANVQQTVNDTIAGRILTVGSAFGLGSDNTIGTRDLNDAQLQASGFYGQATAANATLVRNYPVAAAGTLIVNMATAGTVNQLYQTVTSRLFGRSLTGGVWTTWLEYLSTTAAPVQTFSAAKSLVLTDAAGYWRCTATTGVNVTVPTDASIAFPINTEIHFRQTAAGAITFVPSGGVTINAPTNGTLVTGGIGATVTIKKVAADVWDLFGVTG